MLVTCFASRRREDVRRELSRIRPSRHYELPDVMRSACPGNVERLWSDALDVRGTLAALNLETRHLLPPTRDLRIHPRCPYLPKPKTLYLSALLVAVRKTARLMAIQRIFLDPATAHYSCKVMFGTPLGGAWRGRAGGPTLAIAEGFETADVFSRLHDIPCWASLGARRLDRLVLPTGITSLLIAEDNDSEGRSAAARAAATYARPGLAIHRKPPPAKYNDWAEVLGALG